MPELQREVQRKYAARAKEGDPYRAVAVPADRQALAEVKALMRSWWGPDKRDARPPADVLRIGDFDIEPAPSPAVLMPVAAVPTDFGPAAFPPCDERPTLGLMGKRGCGKTAVLWRIALNDMLDMHGRVIVLGAAPGMSRNSSRTLWKSQSTVAWTPLGTSDDVAMMQRCPYLHSFPQNHRGIATVLAEELNRRNPLRRPR
jgi:hypothetical protein